MENINRAINLMMMGLSQQETAKVLMDNGMSIEDAFLAIKAAGMILEG